MNKAFHIVLFLLLGVVGPGFLALNLNLGRESLEISRLAGLISVFGVGSMAMFLYISIHYFVYRCEPNQELSRWKGILSIVCFLLPSTNF